jgi:signal transduction histidine kinase
MNAVPHRPWLPAWALLLAAVFLPVLAALGVQAQQATSPEQLGVRDLRSARAVVSSALLPPPELAQAAPVQLPLKRPVGPIDALWLAFELPPSSEGLQRLTLAYRPGLLVFLDGERVAQGGDGADGTPGNLLLGEHRMTLDLPRAMPPRRLLQLRLAAPGPSGATLAAPRLGAPEAVQRLDRGRQLWQALRAGTLLAALLVAGFLAMVARVQRDQPLYALGAVHVALLALLLTPWVLTEPPLPSPWWRLLLDGADLCAKLLLVAIAAQLAQAAQAPLRGLLWGVAAVGLPLDAWAAWHGWAWSDFSHPWPWWALGVRLALFGLAWALALRALCQRPSAASAGTAMLVGFSACTWVVVSASVLVLGRPVVDSNGLAHAGWVVWVAVLLQRLFTESARREAALRDGLRTELQARSSELQTAYAARAQAEREHAASEQRRRLLQDLHDGLGAQLLTVRLRAAEWEPDQLARALDACLVEMRLSVDTLAEDQGDLGVLLGGWRRRVDGTLRAAGMAFDWQVHDAPVLPCLQGGGGLDLVRGLQELLSNAIRHAQAGRIAVCSQREGDWLVLWVVDDGCGLGPVPGRGHGLRSVEDRARRLGGQVEWISPAPPPWQHGGPGTAVAWRLPLKAAADAAAGQSPSAASSASM